MRARPRRGALGLRGRIVGVVLVTTVATLLVAAIALPAYQDYVKRAAQLGVWKKHDHLRIPNERVVSIRRLGEF